MEDGLQGLLGRAKSRSTLSNILLPFCSDFDSPEPIALLSGQLNLVKTLRKDGQHISLDDALGSLPDHLKTSAHIVDLTEEMKKFAIAREDTDGPVSESKEIEIKEAITEKDEQIVSNRAHRRSHHPDENHAEPEFPAKLANKLSDDVEALLREAELEEACSDSQSTSSADKSASKLKQIKNVISSESRHVKSLPKLKTTRGSTNNIVGDIIEHVNDNHSASVPNGYDEVSSRVLLTDLMRQDLQKTNITEEEEEEVVLKKPSRFKSSKRTED